MLPELWAVLKKAPKKLLVLATQQVKLVQKIRDLLRKAPSSLECICVVQIARSLLLTQIEKLECGWSLTDPCGTSCQLCQLFSITAIYHCPLYIYMAANCEASLEAGRELR